MFNLGPDLEGFLLLIVAVSMRDPKLEALALDMLRHLPALHALAHEEATACAAAPWPALETSMSVLAKAPLCLPPKQLQRLQRCSTQPSRPLDVNQRF